MLTERLVLNLTTVHSLIRWREGEPHPILATVPAWYDQDTMRAMDRHALGELDRNGLLHRGRPDPDLNETISALIRPDRELYGWISTTVRGRPFHYGVLAIATYQEAVLVVRNHDTDATLLATIRSSELTNAFLSQLPALPPAPGQPISTPYDDFLAPTEPTGDGFTGFRTRQGPHVRTINAILTQPRTGGGSIYAAGRTSSYGTRRRSKQPLNYLDTATGRWLAQLDTGTDHRIATLRPASIALIATQLARTRHQLGHGD